MCGIVGYTGNKQAAPFLLDGLGALEYRGYDSSGIITIDKKGGANLRKTVGRVSELTTLVGNEPVTGTYGIGHTRWATHGGVTKENSHPHTSNDGCFFVVHNGIIENHSQLRNQLEKNGFRFYSQTDTEVVPNLLEYYYNKTNSVEKAFETVLHELDGAYALALVSTHEPNTIYAAKLSSPLVIGVGKSESAIASDPSALPETCSSVVFLGDNEYAKITARTLEVKNVNNNQPVSYEKEYISDLSSLKSSLGDFEHYMMKEIHDIPETIRAATAGRVRSGSPVVRLGGLDNVQRDLQFIDRIAIVACGTSYYAGLTGEYLIEELAGIPVEVQVASEFRYRTEPFSPTTALLAISQSGETADTLAALKKTEVNGLLQLGIVNAPGSTIARTTKAGVYCHAGPEKAVASTKAFIAQVCVLALMGLYLSPKTSNLHLGVIEELCLLDKKAEEIIKNKKTIEGVAKKYKDYDDMLFIGRRYGNPVALEGALKLKELSYVHAESYPAGELKHGPLALIDENMPVLVVIPHDDLYDKTLSSIQEIKARGGKIIALTDKVTKELRTLADDIICVPQPTPQLQPVLSATALHLFAYYIAKERGCPIDMPRNLAKSVTVE